MNTLGLLLEGAWHVLLAGLVLGAGLPAIFSLGIRALAWGATSGDTVTSHHPPLGAKLAAGLCFGVVVSAIGLGIGIIVASGLGYQVVVGWPVFVPK